jgi:hypothetical protein
MGNTIIRKGSRVTVLEDPHFPRCQRCFREYEGHFDLCEVEVEPLTECRYTKEVITLPPETEPDALPKSHIETKVWWKKRKMFVCRICIKQSDQVVFDLTREQRRQLRTREKH